MRHSLRTLLTAAALATATVAAHSPAGAASALGPACGKGDAHIPGHYSLHGVMEVGSEIVLRKDGSFEFYLAYGANDQYGKGCWTQHGKNVALIPAGKRTISGTHTPADRRFTGMLLKVDGRDLVWEIPYGGKGRYRK
ncbi:MAG: hypothetical protein ABIF45_06810 [Pseudomonadota bacterium]